MLFKSKDDSVKTISYKIAKEIKKKNDEKKKKKPFSTFERLGDIGRGVG